MNRSRMNYSWMAACLLMLNGCAQSIPPDHQLITEKVTLKSEPQQAVSIDPKGRVIGEARSFHVTKMKSVTIDNKLRVQIEVLNDRGRRDILYFRIRWMDEVGAMLGQYEPWQTESFEGGQSSVINFESPTEKATDFRFELKPQN